jgi:hypothetical protein
LSYAELPHAKEMDGVVLMTLCREPGPWALDELTRVLGPGVHVEDAVNRLRRRGLVLQMKGGLVASSAAGRYALAVEEATP